MVKNRLAELLAEKSRIEGRVIHKPEVADCTGIALSSIKSWSYNNVTRFDARHINSFCKYFDCEISDLLVISNNHDS